MKYIVPFGRSPARLGASQARDHRSRPEYRAKDLTCAPRRWFCTGNHIPVSIVSFQSQFEGRILSRAASTEPSPQAGESSRPLSKRKAWSEGCIQSCSPPIVADGPFKVELFVAESPSGWRRRSSRRTPAKRGLLEVPSSARRTLPPRPRWPDS